MKGAFVSTFRLPPPSGRAIMVRDGANVYWAAYSKWQDQWFMLIPGANDQKIDPPLFWFCRDSDSKSLSEEAQKEVAKPTPEPAITRRGQMLLALGRVA